MNLYDEFYPLVVEMLEEFGGNATLSRTAPAAPSLADKRAGRAAPAQAAQDSPVRAAVGPMAVQGVDGRRETRTVATMLVEPREGDKLVMGESSYIVGSVTRVAPQGKAIVYMAEVS
jgi:hypothetical protein